MSNKRPKRVEITQGVYRGFKVRVLEHLPNGNIKISLTDTPIPKHADIIELKPDEHKPIK